jgi:hypothetical protein
MLAVAAKYAEVLLSSVRTSRMRWRADASEWSSAIADRLDSG